MGWMDEDVEFESLLGRVISAIDNHGDEIFFTMENGERYKMYHSQDCCESVSVEDIVGDLDDLIGHPVLRAEVATDTNSPKTETWGDGSYAWTDESSTWTFYKLATIKGSVDIRWYGSSNGYYSESVDFVKAPTAH